MVVQSVRNLPEFHGVFADSLIAIINKVATDESQAKKIIIFNIRYSYILYRMDNTAQRTHIDRNVEICRLNQKEGKLKVQGVIDYDYVLKNELDEMTLDKLPLDELEIKMFTYMTLAGIKPVQNTQQRATLYSRFAAGQEGIA